MIMQVFQTIAPPPMSLNKFFSIKNSSLFSVNISILTDFLLFFKWLPKITPLTLPSHTKGEGKEECVGDMNQNIFNDTDFSRFTSLFPPYSPIALLPYKEWQMGESL